MRTYVTATLVALLGAAVLAAAASAAAPTKGGVYQGELFATPNSPDIVAAMLRARLAA